MAGKAKERRSRWSLTGGSSHIGWFHLLIFATVLSLFFIATLAYSGGCISNPHGTIIEVAPGENFLLHYRLYWDDPTTDGTFGITLFWNNHENRPTENLTYLSTRAYYDNQDNIPILVDLSSAPQGENTLWCLDIGNSLAENGPQPYDTNFNVDIWMRAAGVGNVPHKPGDHLITGGGFKAVHVDEQFIEDIPGTEKPITIRVVSRGVGVSISPSEKSGLPRTTLNYTITITNSGAEDDNYILTVIDNENWAPTLSDYRVVNLQPGENENATLTVTVPEDAAPGLTDSITVTATSQTYPTVRDSASCTAVVSAAPLGVQVSVFPSSKSGEPGKELTYTVTVNNTGGAGDTYSLTALDVEDWGPTISPASLTVAGGGSGTATLSIKVPDNAAEGDSTTITVTATSQADPAISDSATCAAIATEVLPSPPPIPYPVIAGVAIGVGVVVVIILLLKRRMLHSRVKFLTLRPTPFKGSKSPQEAPNPN